MYHMMIDVEYKKESVSYERYDVVDNLDGVALKTE